MTTAGAQRPGFGPALLGIVAVGVVLRVVYTLVESPWPPPGLDDQFFFSALPKLLADGRGFIAPFKWAFEQHATVATAEHPPLYSVVLTLPALVGLDSADAFRLAGTVFGAGTIALVGLLGRRLAGDRAGLIAAGLAAVYPTLIAADGALMSETLYGLLIAASLLAAYRLYDAPGLRQAAVFGALVALTALARGEALLLVLLLVPLLWRRGAEEAPGGWRVVLAGVLAFAIVLTPWTARNWIVFNRPVAIATNSGTAVAGANCAVTYAAGDHLGGWYPPCIKEHPGKNEAEHHALALEDGIRYARHHAGRLPVVLAARLGRVWSVYKPFAIPEGRSVRVQKLGVIAFFLLVPFAVGGYLLLRRRGELTWILLTPFIIVAVTALTTYGNLRFREPAEVALVVLAGVAIDALVRRRAAVA